MERSALKPEDRKRIQAVFSDTPDSSCKHCGGYHLRACPRIKLMKWEGQGAGTGNVIEVEYWPSGEYDDSETLYPEDVFQEEDDG